MKVKPAIITFLHLILFVILVVSVNGSVWNSLYCQALPVSCETPKVILQSGTAGTSIIYTNNTSAKVSVVAPAPVPSSYDYVLKVVNQVLDVWNASLKVYNSSNIARLSNMTISFHDGTSSDQIIINNGTITQSQGASYDLTGNATIYISISNLQATTTDTSYLYVYLKILVPNTSTYNLFIIVFEIT